MTTATKERRTKAAGGTTLSAADLKAALDAVRDAAKGHAVRPVLNNVLLQDETVTATDLEIRITAPLPGATGPALLLPFARLQQIVGSLAATDEVTLTVDGTACVVKAGRGTWRLPVEDAAEFPACTGGDGKPIAKLPADQFRALLNTVRFATDKESSRYALGGVLFDFERPEDKESDYGKLSFVASDGRRMTVATCDVANDCDGSQTLVPRRVIDTLVALCSGAESIQLDTTGSELVATVDDTVVRARLVDGKFPRWRDIEPEHKTSQTLVVVGSLLHACRQASVCASETSRGVKFAFSADGLWIHGKSAEYGESSATCDLVEAGQPGVVRLDPRFVTEWLSSLDAAETINVSVKDGDSAVVLRAGDCRTTIMPMSEDA